MYASGMTLRQIGAVTGVPHRTVNRYLKLAGVELRNPGNPKITELQSSDWLSAKYEGEGLSTTQIAQQIDCEASLVSQYLAKHGIESRGVGSQRGHKRNTEHVRAKMSRAKRGKKTGSDNPNWRGGQKSVDPERNRYRAKSWSKQIRLRDGICQTCGSFGPLHAHHLKRWKDYPELRYDLSNGVALCQSCHEAAHGRGFKFHWSQ